MPTGQFHTSLRTASQTEAAPVAKPHDSIGVNGDGPVYAVSTTRVPRIAQRAWSGLIPGRRQRLATS
jgi:hypothetical protein